jgi:hypothetical protein
MALACCVNVFVPVPFSVLMLRLWDGLAIGGASGQFP